ncbi:hypothetical protein [Streptomyces sp. RTd22]|uniref:hypothetical protein n=1 Tax=Streptomyces sp. RTd22 TaxID=1841249 RepID=UPI0007C5120C|nr:hypothetical protein [Streptomyces sp. RTd22]
MPAYDSGRLPLANAGGRYRRLAAVRADMAPQVATFEATLHDTVTPCVQPHLRPAAAIAERGC